MKTSSKLLAGLLAAGIALPALAQTAQPAPPPPQAAGGPEAKGPPQGPGGPGRMMRSDRRDRPSMLWNVSSRLAAAQTALGITADQQESWNAFTRAAIAFVEAGRPGRMGPDIAPQDDEDETGLATDDAAAEATEEATPSLPDGRPFMRVDRMLERSIARGQAAETLRTAMAQLAGELTPEQTATAERLLRELPRPGRHGKGPHQHRQHERWQERGDRR